MNHRNLDDIKIHVKLKLAFLWASVMFCFIYGDYFGLYVPGQLKGMLDGQGPLGPTSQSSLAIVAALLAIPGLMVFLSVALAPSVSRWLNIVFGLLYTLFVLITMPGAWAFYILMSIIEVLLTVLIVWYAWTWPKSNGGETIGA